MKKRAEGTCELNTDDYLHSRRTAHSFRLCTAQTIKSSSLAVLLAHLDRITPSPLLLLVLTAVLAAVVGIPHSMPRFDRGKSCLSFGSSSSVIVRAQISDSASVETVLQQCSRYSSLSTTAAAACVCLFLGSMLVRPSLVSVFHSSTSQGRCSST